MAVIPIRLVVACLKFVAFWTLALILACVPIRAQKGGSTGGGTGGSRGGPPGGGVPRGAGPGRAGPPPLQPGNYPYPDPEADVLFPTTQPLPKPVLVEDDTCLPWDLAAARSGTVSAVRLGVPGKARSQYEKACSAFKKNNMSEAEQHARDAIQKYPNYPAAWVMLGQALQGERKLDEAHDACSKPLTVDPTYLPPYLCLAGLLNHERQWSDLLALTDRFHGMNPVADMYASYYRGLALFHMGNLPEAQKSVSQAIAIDTEHHQPGFFFLLAQIYGEQRDLIDATVQIQQFQKFTNSKQDKDSANEYLSELQSRLNAK
jgi:tetratricopeptide (TPR) repeat protein